MVELLEAAWSVPTDALLSHYSSDRTRGLTTPQAKAHLEAFGPNELPAEEATPFWKLVLKQFDDLLVKVLLLAALTSFVLALLEEDPHSAHSAHSEHSEHSAHSDEGGLFAGLGAFVEPGVILLILAINAAVGVVQEANAEKAIEALKSYEPENAKVVRDGKVNVVPAADVVPGDIVEVARGDKIPADMRVIELQATSVRCDQAILTGESVSVPKVEEVVSDARAVNQDKVNVLFKGTTVSVGKVRCCVIGTGSTTEFGKIQGVLSETETVDSPLKVKLDEFGEMLSKVILVICILVWVINVGHFNDPVHGSFFKGAIYYFKIAVALAVAAIPEGLPAVVTTCLALGTMKMAKKKAIVRSLPSVETLGCTTVICSDKTGTLTTNMMSVSKIVTVRTSSGAIEEYDVEGSTFAPDGEVATASGDVVECPSDGGAALAKAAEISALCNDSTIHYNADTGAFEKVGEATETALKVLVEKLGHPDLAEARAIRAIPPQDRFLAVNGHWEQERPKLVTLEFSRDRKSMSVVVAGGADAGAGSPALSAKSSSGSESPVRRTTRSSARRAKAASAGGRTLLCKGAPENILDRCDSVLTEKGDVVKLTKAIRQKLDARILELSTGSSTLRCLGLAYRENCEDPEDMDLSDPSRLSRYETGMTFASVVGMMDPPRAEVRGAIETCGKAGIRVIVITGDNKNTAEAICRRIGVFSEDEDVSDLSYTGREFDDMTPSEQIAAVKRARLFSRTEPAHKARLVDLLQQQGEVAAMTGDGVNDAPALKKADIGIATGTGTAVAKEASEMVLADDNFATIVAAVEEGRAIYNNTKQFIRYLISSNIGEVVSIFLASALGMPDALIPVQLLWMNLVTDGLPATALGFNPPDADIMEIAPRSSKDPIVGGWLFIRYMVIGIYIGAATCAGYAYWYLYFEGGPQISWAVLTNHLSCEGDVCKYFLPEYAFKASTVSLSVLVMIEMFNAFNSLSENQSVFVMSPFVNIWLILAVILSTVLHIAILYTPVLASIFSVAPLSMEEWKIVLWLSVPVIVVDELLKIVSRAITPKAVDLVKTKQD